MKIALAALIFLIVLIVAGGALFLIGKTDYGRSDTHTPDSLIVVISLGLILIGFPLFAFLTSH